MHNMRTIERLLSEYGESHQNPTNKLIHWICVPIIFWTVTALLWAVKIPYIIPGLEIELNLALIALVFVLGYYLTLSFTISFGMLLYSIGCAALSYYIEENVGFPLWAIALIAFVVAWIFQFIGHNVEGKKPSFLKDLQFLLVGPAWLMHFIFKSIGLKY